MIGVQLAVHHVVVTCSVLALPVFCRLSHCLYQLCFFCSPAVHEDFSTGTASVPSVCLNEDTTGTLVVPCMSSALSSCTQCISVCPLLWSVCTRTPMGARRPSHWLGPCCGLCVASGKPVAAGVCLLVGYLTSQQHVSVSQGRICSDNFTCCHTEIEVTDQTFYLTQSQYTDTGPTSPSADPITPGAWQGSHWSANF